MTFLIGGFRLTNFGDFRLTVFGQFNPTLTLCWCGVFDFDIQVASIFLCISEIFLLTPYVFIYVFHLNSKGMQY